jgi:plasmid stabilization system protein ParE
MPQLIWSAASLQDVARLHAFLKTQNPDAARRAISTIRQGVRVLAKHPEIGKPVPDLDPAYRSWPIAFGTGGYLALYRIDRQNLVILAVRHFREQSFRTD